MSPHTQPEPMHTIRIVFVYELFVYQNIIVYNFLTRIYINVNYKPMVLHQQDLFMNYNITLQNIIFILQL